MISFTVYGNAVQKGSTRPFPIMKDGKPVLSKTGRPVVVTTGANPKTKEWQYKIWLAAQQLNLDSLLDGAIGLEVFFYLQRPKSVTVKKRPYPTVAPDLDKLLRTMGDALKGVVYTDDSRLCDLKMQKRYGDPPRAEIRIYELEG